MMVQGDDDRLVLWRHEGGDGSVGRLALCVWDIVIVYLWWCRVRMTAWSCDDTKVVTAASDASLCVWDIVYSLFMMVQGDDDGLVLWWHKGGDGSVGRLALCPDHCYSLFMMMQGDDDGLVLWRYQGGDGSVRRLTLCVWDIVIVCLWWYRVTVTAWSFDDTMVVTAVSDASLCVWDIVIVYLWWCRVMMTAWSCDDTMVVTPCLVSIPLL